jgi:hypothetical protein
VIIQGINDSMMNPSFVIQMQLSLSGFNTETVYSRSTEWTHKQHRSLMYTAVTEACMGADKSLAFPISYFPICSTTKRIFLRRVKEVRTTKS